MVCRGVETQVHETELRKQISVHVFDNHRSYGVSKRDWVNNSAAIYRYITNDDVTR